MKFIDSIEIKVRSGKGGTGMVRFSSAKNRAKMGCDGGDGGFGGNVYFVGKSNLNTLSALFRNRIYAAKNGAKGGTNCRTGHDGEDLVIPVPLGTEVLDQTTGEKITEILEDNEQYLIAKGGKRGLGNQRFLSATHQAPEEFTDGGEGEEKSVRLELKLIADAGFAGFPNAGKSTLLSRISSAQPKIADYPFTTLSPQLGVVSPGGVGWGASFVAADIPGLIEGASIGKGLGIEFLKHLERTKVIVYVLDGASVDGLAPIDAYYKLQQELQNYSQKLADKPKFIMVTKSDLIEGEEARKALHTPLLKVTDQIVSVSAVTGEGIEDFKRTLYNFIQQEAEKIVVTVDEPIKIDRKSEFEFITRATEDEDLGIW